MKDHESITAVLQFLREMQREYKEAQGAEQEADRQLQDIAHRLEIYTDSYHDTARLGKIFREVRRRRRKAKEVQEYAEPIIRWMENNRAAISSLEKLLGTLRHIREVQEKRAYFPRSHILDDMTDGEQRSMRGNMNSPKAAGGGKKKR